MDIQPKKVLGMVPTQYIDVFYYCLMGATALTLLNAVVGIIGVLNPILYAIANLLYLAALVLALLGMFVFQKDLNTVERGHLQFVGLLTILFMIVNSVLNSIFFTIGGPIAAAIVSLIIMGIHLVFLYACFLLWKQRASLTIELVKDKMMSLTKRVK